ncbi:RNase P modulator RnpM [Alkalihalobacillus sp. AL-G]|uniref:RNase P modulator RnpM n=1 Tax=Alkalihalobacillus sp. AL-G TaxID=2926399 RepID=UPI00272AE84A|nr:YlxR family protein [Alkalihalobacillus sp. AL-G]WLD95194.1 YlxR family protein [Alkalihalobacillus sp. AL-G]
MKKRKIPMRKCVACQENKPKKELIRIVRSPEGNVSIDHSGKKSGRGAYICNQKSCFELAHKKKTLQNQLAAQVDDTVYEELKKQVSETRD